MGMVAMGLGKKTAELTADDLPEIRDALFKLKDNAALVGEVVASQTALATGQVDVLVGGGEWVTAGLSQENPDLDWILPEQGGVMWSQSIGVFADSGRKDLAAEFVKYILSPEGQAKLATSSCYWAMPANEAAGEHLSDQQKRALRWDDQDRVPEERPALSRSGRRARCQDAGRLGRVPAALRARHREPGEMASVDRRGRGDMGPWAFVAPALLWTVAFFCVPFAVMAVVSLWERVGTDLVRSWSLVNYAKFFSRGHFLEAMLNSLEVTLTVTALSILLAYPLAWILAEKVPPRWQRIGLIAAILPFWTS